MWICLETWQNLSQWNDSYWWGFQNKKKPYLTYDIVVESSKLNIPKLSKEQLSLFDKICELRSEGLTYKQVAVRLNELGIPPTRGGKHNAQKVWSNYTKIKKNLDRKIEVTSLDVDNVNLVWE